MSNAQKTPLSRTLPLFGQRKALDEIAKRGQALPGHVTSVVGQIVTVNFDVAGLTLPKVSMPVYGSEYIRLPIQNGDKGVAFPASVYIGGVSGLGAGTGDDTLQGNLSTLVWLPIGNANWTAPPGSDADTLALYGHLALLLLDSLSNHSSLKLSSSGITLTFGSGSITMSSSAITLTFGGHSVVINSSGVTIDGKTFLTHAHTGVTTGSGTSGPVA
jgi:hypothetical protein